MNGIMYFVNVIPVGKKSKQQLEFKWLDLSKYIFIIHVSSFEHSVYSITILIRLILKQFMK